MGALNKDLVRKILMVLAEANGNFMELSYSRITGYSPQDIRGYMHIMTEGKLTELREPVNNPSDAVYPMTVRITWGGYDWLEQNPSE